jgi:general secretion pathway protein D
MKSGLNRFYTRTLAVLTLALLGAVSAFAQGQGAGGRGGGGAGGGGGGGGFGGGQGGGAGGTPNANRSNQNTTMVGDAMITSDVDSRRLIVVTDDTTNDNIKTIIAGLDKPKPQVLINVVFLQVTHDNSFDLGAEATYRGPVAIKTNPDSIATSRFGEAAQLANPTVYGAFYQLIGRDVNATIHALSGVTKTEILSRPSILTRSNQQATILVGQSIPIITSSTVNTTTNSIINTPTYTDVGIILKVTPFITADGLVEMIVSPEISSLSATTVAISTGVNAPVIDRRSADTVVVTQSDRTIVIGGLISSQKNDTETKVPILGSIPLLGAAFRRTIKEDIKTELIIFLTPHVVARPEDLGSLTQNERANLNLAPQAFEKADLSRLLPKP